MAIKIRPLVYLEEREDPPGPSLPPYTLRLKFRDGVTPSFSKGTGVLYDAELNIWDLTYENSNWESLLESQTNILEVIEANTSNVTNMRKLFRTCSSLTTVPLFDTSSVTNMNNMFTLCYELSSVPLFDTSNVTNMGSMFYGCRSLSSVLLFDTSKATNMNSMFYHCYNVESGALAIYQQASSQANPPSNHNNTFIDCGSNTQTGSAELAQIPTSWGGTMQE